MSLLQRIKNLESARKKGTDAAMRIAVEAMNRKFSEMTDEELDAIIAEGEVMECDSEWDARLAKMSDDELSRFILEGEMA